MSDLLTASKQALEALEYDEGGWAQFNPVITNLRTAIEQAEKQDPVAWDIRWKDDGSRNVVKDVPQCAQDQYAVPLYTHPAPAVPAGYKLVPIEPTTTMIDALFDKGVEGSDEVLIAGYKAMLNAAPEPTK